MWKSRKIGSKHDTVPPSAWAPHKFGTKLEVPILSLQVSTKLPQATEGMWSPSLHWQVFPQNWCFPWAMECPASRMNPAHRGGCSQPQQLIHGRISPQEPLGLVTMFQHLILDILVFLEQINQLPQWDRGKERCSFYRNSG